MDITGDQGGGTVEAGEKSLNLGEDEARKGTEI